MDESELASQASLEDRIAAKLDHSSSEEPELALDETEELSPPDSEVSDESQGPDFEEIEYDGKTYQIPPELKDALMSKQDYTRKTQELARNREAIEGLQQQARLFAEQQAFEQTTHKERAEIDNLSFQIQQYEALDWSGFEAQDLFKLKMQVDALKSKREDLKNALNGRRQQFAQQLKARRDEIQKGLPDQVRTRIQTWGDQSMDDLSQYALSRGYTQIDVQNLALSPRDIETMWKAQQWDKLQTTKGDALKRAQKAPPVIKPGATKRMPDDTRDKLNYRKALEASRKRGDPAGKTAKIIQKRLEKRFGG